MNAKAVERVVVTVTTVMATAGFAPAFAVPFAVLFSTVGLALAGAAGAASVAFGAWKRGLTWAESLLISTGGFVLACLVVTAGSPERLWWGLSSGWAHVISSTPPLDPEAGLRVLPFAVAWWGAAAGSELLRRPTPLAGLAGPLAALTVTSLVSVGEPAVALGQGVGFGAAILLLLRIRRPASLVIAGLVAATAPFAAPALPFAHARFDLRQHQDRAWDPLSVPSPLVTLKASLKEGRSDSVVFTVHSDHALTRWSLAVLDAFDGRVWAIGDRLIPVDSVFPVPHEDRADADVASYRIEVGDLTGPWLPVGGQVIESHDDLDVHVDPRTGTVAVPSGLAPGATLSMSVVPRPELSRPELADLTVPTIGEDAATPELVPPRLRDRAGDAFEGHGPGMPRVLALAERFVNEGFYDHGPRARPGHSLARMDEFLGDAPIGYAEQYAATAAVLTRIGGVPSRVVVGYEVPEDRYHNGRAEIVGDDISAWIEVLTVEEGWVPIDVTPDRSREPESESPGVEIQEVAIPNPPSPPPPAAAAPPAVQDAEAGEDREPEVETDDDGPPHLFAPPVVFAGRSLGSAAVLLVLGGGLVHLLKARRHRRRRAGSAGQQILGAWDELVDGLRDAGLAPAPLATPCEAARSYCQRDGRVAATAPALESLTAKVDRALFAAIPPSGTDAVEAWEACSAVLRSVRASRRRWERLCMRTDPRSLWS